VCGITGICNLRGEPVDERVLGDMTRALAHRGPDGEGLHVDGNVGLGNRRLAVIDLSEAAAQPIASEDGQVVLTYNGEIYNFAELRAELQEAGHRFRSETDSEVVVHGYEEWGPACVERLSGMFAFALHDRSRRRLFLARDRFGVKPLYWLCSDGLFVFGSEVKSLLRHPRVSAAVCHEALDEYFTFQNVFSDRTLFEGVRLLQPGCMLTIELDGTGEPRLDRYWDFDLAPELGGEAEDEVRERFEAAVTRQLVSDVPVGAYLSGGLDSSSIASVATRSLPRLATFTGGFDLSSASGLELGFDERREAEALSNELKTEHYEVVLHAGDMEWVLPELVWHLEDLRVGQSYPNYYVARLAGKFVKVVLSGAGGDELFGGYPWRYYRGADGESREEFFRGSYAYWQRLTTDEESGALFNDETRRLIGDHSTYDVFRGVFDGWHNGFETSEERVNASLYFELKTFLHGLLVVEDKLSMAHSLETRVPFLDEQLVDLALRISPGAKLANLAGTSHVDENIVGKRLLYESSTADGKLVLRNAMAPLLPSSITGRHKTGFSAPDASWFRGESIDYINRLLRDPHAEIYHFLSRSSVERTLDEHCSGRVNHRLLIWSLLSFEWWCRIFLGGAVPDSVQDSAQRRRGVASTR
jgi:asparagine synthase (glutamine-hydrolysing)